MSEIVKGFSWAKDFSDRIKKERQIRRFANQIGDRNPLHHHTGAAQKAGLLGIIAPGVMTIGFVSSMIAEKIPMVKVYRLDISFAHALYAGSRPVVLCEIVNRKRMVAEVAITVKNGADVVATGTCMLVLPQ